MSGIYQKVVASVIEVEGQKEIIDLCLKIVIGKMNEGQKGKLMNALEKNVVHIEKMSPNRLFNCYCTNITFQCTADLAKTFLDLVKEKYPNGLFEYTPIK